MPAIVLSGFLGSGKTTLLLRLLEATLHKGLKPAILMNELGKRDVDGIGLNPMGKDLGIQKLLDGCVCCSRKQELAGKLKELLLLKPDIVFIELTGVANPEEVALALSEAELIAKVKLHKVVTVMDAEHVLEYNSWLDTDRQLVRTLRRQIETADLLILNKVDLVKADKLVKIEKEIRKQNASSLLMRAEHSVIDLEPILGGIEAAQGAAVGSRVMRPGRSPLVKKKDSANDTYSATTPETRPAPSFSRISTISLQLPADSSVTPKEIEKFLGAQGNNLLRAKGFVRIPRKNKVYQLQFAGKRVTWEPAAYYDADSYLVLIGLDWNEQNVTEAWEQLVST
ncbi:CobW family GTP-binding protein [Cohnella silvisoli]|uniref:GTP-binding protein n=1 Tax=Cohnella silvisoli TaxID=2873699 RepID=A0ABV1KQV7_9BACL|nr:GTP-binding protein [Cohnella silvisoli]MCD9024561.1 GTP-binding protein [Cohnella silvisoli]